MPVTIGLDRPELLGTLTVGYLLDNDRAASFKALTGADIAFAIDGQVRASTLGPDAHARLSGLLGAELVPRTMIGDSEYAALVRALHAPHDEASTGADGADRHRAALAHRAHAHALGDSDRSRPGRARHGRCSPSPSATAWRARSRGRWRRSPITCGRSPSTGDLTRKLRLERFARAGTTKIRGCSPRPSTRSPTRSRASSARRRSASGCRRSAGCRRSSRTRFAIR